MIRQEQRTIYITSDNKEFASGGEARKHEIAYRLNLFLSARRACAGNDLEREEIVELLADNANAVVDILLLVDTLEKEG